MKHFLNLRAIGVMVWLLFMLGVSCEHDLNEPRVQSPAHNISLQHISSHDLDVNTAEEMHTKIAQIQKEHAKSNEHEKFEYNETLGVYIDLDKGVLINNNGKLSYTYPMYRDSEDKLENIVFTPADNGEMEAFFVKYNVTPEQYNELSVQETQNLIPEFQKVTAAGAEYVCVDIIYTVTTYDGCTETHSNGETCGGETTSYVTSFCGFTSGGGGESSPIPDSQSNQGNDDSSWYNNEGSSGNSGGSTSGGVTTTPIVIQPWEEIRICMPEVIQIDGALTWLQDHKHQAGQINTFLQESSCSDEAQGFAAEAIVVLQDNNQDGLPDGEVDFDNEVIFNVGCPEGYSLNDEGVCEQNPVLSADCRSFEFAQPSGEIIRACAVSNLYTRFYAYGVKDGKTGVFEVFVRYPIIYFTAPTNMTNGFAANKTARAVTDAIRDTESWFAANPYATKEQVGLKLDLLLTTHLALFGGTWRLTPPFNIPSPAPYLSSLTGTGNCN